MKKIRVLYIHHGVGIGGAAISLLNLVKGLDKNCFEPIVLFLHDSDATGLFRDNGIEVLGPAREWDFPHTRIWWHRWYHIIPFFKSIRSMVRIVQTVGPAWIEAIKPDIVHLNTSSLIAWARVARAKNIPVVWHIREPLALGYMGLRKWFVRHCVRRYSCAITPICRHDARPWEGLDKTHVVYNAVNETQFCAREQATDLPPRILFLGGLSAEKGTLLILKAFKKVAARLPQAQLLIAGYFDMRKTRGWSVRYFLPSQVYQRAVEHELKGVQHNVRLLGAIKNVQDVMAKSDVVVFPATTGHFARPIIEAGFMKKPVVASDLAPLDELVIDGVTGYLISPLDVDAWAKVLCKILQDRQLARDLGERNYEFCSKNFLLAKQIEKITKIYINLLEGVV